MKKFILIIFIFLLMIPKSIHAQTEVANNKFGIHIIDENDLEKAAELVNSNGGQWGYVTIVIREDERNHSRWQEIFNQMRRLKLIPIVRIATKIEKENWAKPKLEETNNWAAFLDGLLWPVKNRYVILFNEPNHSKEWGGEIAPKEYAQIVKQFEKSLLNHSDEFKILPAAMDLAAPNSGITMEASRYWDLMHEADNFIFTRFDIWNSHSYPNPGFSGEVTDSGKTSIQGYKWELNYLENLGLNPDIDVFITETGWINSNNNLAEKYDFAFNNIWNDSRIKAVTPFILKYNQAPFSTFSFINTDNSTTDQFNRVKSLDKEKGRPHQHHDFKLKSNTIAKSLVTSSEYKFFVNLVNTGQSIWNAEDDFSLHFSSTLNSDQIEIGELDNVEPFQTARVPVFIKTIQKGKHRITLQLNKSGEQIGNLIQTNFEIIAPPSMLIKVKQDNNYVLTLRKEERQIMQIEDILVIDGSISIPSIFNVIPGEEYELTINKNYHLPKTKKFVLNKDENIVKFGNLLPLDFDNNDQLSIGDLYKHILNPINTNILLKPF